MIRGGKFTGALATPFTVVINWLLVLIVLEIELTMGAEARILLTLVVIILALEDITLLPVALGKFCKTTSPFSFTVKNLLVTKEDVGLKLLVKLVKRKPENPFLPCLISTLLPGAEVPIPTLPSTNIPFKGAMMALVSIVLDLGTKLLPITTPPFTSNLLAGMILFPKPNPVFPLLWINKR